MNKKIIRESNYDLLRILACIAVIMIHANAGYLIALIETNSYGIKYASWIVLYGVISRFAVPIFVMLSGAFLLADKRNENRKYFYKKSIKSILIPVAIFSIFYFLFSECQSLYAITTWEAGVRDLLVNVKNLIVGEPYYHMWYMFTLIGLYLIIPDIIHYQQIIKNKKIYIFIFVWCVISGVAQTNPIHYSISKIVPYIGYILVGYEIRQYTLNKKNNKKGIVLILLGFLLEVILAYFVLNYSISTESDIIKSLFGLGNFSPFIVISSLLIFTGFSYLNINRNFYKTASKTFYIYLIHVFVLTLLEFIIERTIGIKGDIRIIIPIKIIITFIFSYILTNVYLYLYNKINKNDFITKKVYKLFKLN